ncbi:hypothetical protein CWN54_40635, partial [Klebsiella pneumoniae]
SHSSAASDVYKIQVSQPFSMTHASIPLEKRLANGITPQLIRLSVGIEDPNDLIADWQQALRAE